MNISNQDSGISRNTNKVEKGKVKPYIPNAVTIDPSERSDAQSETYPDIDKLNQSITKND